MNRRHIWTIAPLGLLVTLLTLYAHAQTNSSPAESPTVTDLLSLTQRANVIQTVRGTSKARTGRSKPQSLEHKLEKQTGTLVQKYRSTSDTGERQSLRDDLQKVVTEHFDLRQASRQRELDELEKELKRLRSHHQRRQNQKDNIVNNRVDSLLREADGLGWGSRSSNGRLAPRGFRGSFPSYNTPASTPPINTEAPSR